MADRPPPSRYSIVERGGRLVVIDRDTGRTPLTAAERMAEHDRRMGVEPIRPARPGVAPDVPAASRAESDLRARPAPTAPDQGKARIAAAIAERNKRPWGAPSSDRPPPKSDPAPARIAARPAPPAGGARKTITTAKWWDAKGPRTIDLGPRGQQVLGGGFVTLFFVALIAAIVLLIISPVALFVTAFLIFRWGGSALAPVGAGIVDKAVAEKG